MDVRKQNPSTSLNLSPGDVPTTTTTETAVPQYIQEALSGRPFASPARSDTSEASMNYPLSPLQGTLPLKGVQKRQGKKKSNDLNNLKWKRDSNGDIWFKSNGSVFKKAPEGFESLLLQLNDPESKECDKGSRGQSANRYHELVKIAESTVGIDLNLCDVTKLRRISTALRKVNFMSRQEIEEKEKVKFLWKKPPESWPAEIEHFDPNNKGALDHKPHKDHLLPMVIYLQEKYMAVRASVLAQDRGRETQLPSVVQETPMETDESVGFPTPSAPLAASNQGTPCMSDNSGFDVPASYSTLPPICVLPGGQQYIIIEAPGARLEISSGWYIPPSTGGQQYMFINDSGTVFDDVETLLSQDGNQTVVQQQSFDIQQDFQETSLTYKQEGLKKTPSMILQPSTADCQDTQLTNVYRDVQLTNGLSEMCEPLGDISNQAETLLLWQQDNPEEFVKALEEFSQNQVIEIPLTAMMSGEDPCMNQGPLPDLDNLAPMEEIVG